MYAAGLSCVRKGLGGSFYKIFVWVLLSLNTRCGRGRACFVVVGKIGAFISDRFQWILSDISSLPRRNATGVVCIFLIWGIDDVYIVLFSVKPLTVTIGRTSRPPPDGAPLRASKFRRSGRGRAVVPAFRGSRRDATRALSFGFRRRVLSSDATYTPSRDRIGYQPPPPPGRRTPSIVVSMLVDPVSTPPPDRTSSPAAAAASSEPMPTLAGAPARKCRLADHPERRVLDPPRYPGSV